MIFSEQFAHDNVGVYHLLQLGDSPEMVSRAQAYGSARLTLDT